ncbi:hypothetical protein K0I63_09425 [Shewanella rhizosphaerae]|uniref:hypothetical protein n=1 Tax=Shewanella rhizosphaerae TaxID=2864207 RepID=UPI001C655C94|nr:hypothetical protein [Shewanella rhizosphaerae]QYK14671.1 hypothetical protein K0I63_09425 [Shewanella rhizosphaerae]
MIFSEVIAFIQLAKLPFDWIKKQLATVPETPASRFIALFNAHGVKPSQIPDFFGHGLSIGDCQSAESLTKVLTSGHIEKATKLFSVNKDWLDCASEQVYEPQSFYKNPQGFESYIDSLCANSSMPVRAELYLPTRSKPFYPDHTGLLMISVPIGEVNQRTIYRFELVLYEGAFYWRTRGYLAVNLAYMLRKYSVVFGCYVPPKLLEPIAQGLRLPVYEYASQRASAIRVQGRCSIEELVSCPAAFLQDVDPERENFGHRAALELWLSMADKMAIWDKAQHSGIVATFEDELTRFSH